MAEEAPDFLPLLQKALTVRAEWLETTSVPLLKEALRTYRALFQSIVGTLIKKGMLREDRYDYGGKTQAINPPADGPFTEAPSADEMSARITAYGRQLDFLVDEMQVSLAALDLPTLKKISSLLSYIDWGSFSESSHSATTRALAQLVTRVRPSLDTLSVRVLHESENQTPRLMADIRARVADVESWARESWKAAVRARALAAVPARGARAKTEQAEEVQAIRKVFDHALPTAGWHPALVLEILAEDRSEDAAERREKLLASLAIPQTGPAHGDAAPDLRRELLDAILSLCRVKADIAFAETVLLENERELDKRSLSVFQRLRRWLQKSLGRLDDRYYEIETRESPKAETRKESIDFLRFVAELREAQGMLSELSEEDGPERRRIEAMSQKELFDFLDWQIHLLRRTHQRMDALNVLFQLKAVHLRGATARSIKLELLGLENGLVRAEKARHDSVARLPKQEMAQG
jgi:hypothetical protein